MDLKPQDLLVALKVLTQGTAHWNQRVLAQSLGMSLSEVNGAIRRAIQAGLMLKSATRDQSPQAVPYALQEFIEHGVRYAFPLERGPITRGIITGAAGAKIERGLLNPEISVWPSPLGKVRGTGIKPLYKSIPEIAEREGNEELHVILSLVDMIREGRAREKSIASMEISKMIGSVSRND